MMSQWRRVRALVGGQHAIGRIIGTSVAQIATTVVSSGLGFVFWWHAAQTAPAATVGFASASIVAMNLLTTAGMLGIGTHLMGALQRQRAEAGRLIFNGLLVVGGVTFVLAVVCAVLITVLMTASSYMGDTPGQIALFALGVSVNTLTTMIDQVALGLQRGPLQFARNYIFSGGKFALLVGVSFSQLMAFHWTIYVVWLLANGLSLLVVAPAIVRQIDWRQCRPHRATLRAMLRPALGHHLLNLVLSAPSQVLPLLVATLVSATANAYFYTAWLVISFFLTIPFSVTTSLYAVGADQPGELAQKVRFTLRSCLLIAGGSTVFLMFAAPLILRIFGPAYARNAAPLLMVLIWASFGIVVRDHVVAIGRITQRIRFTLTIMTLTMISELSGAIIGIALGGVLGLCLGWVSVLFCEALAVSPILVRLLRQPAQEAVALSAVVRAPVLPLYTFPPGESMPMPQITGAILRRYRQETHPGLAAAAPPGVSYRLKPVDAPTPRLARYTRPADVRPAPGDDQATLDRREVVGSSAPRIER